ncbi:MAG: M48 family metalloprotease [Zoogloeaceae bacterium]|nr:M48 family metalloprotease [Zoogloeaceae bacterium]MCK6383849.1 M48 family metallopeptidase [Rhodocyclaceae bacterium]
MRLENRAPDEAVNYADEHPLKEFALLVIGVLGTIALAAALLGYFAGEIAARVPFAVEREYAQSVSGRWEAAAKTPEQLAARDALRALAAKLAAAMALPQDMSIAVHYADEAAVNAMATLGGNLVFFRGLLHRLESEDAVAMVLAHEIAHVQLRHPASAMGRGVAIGLALSAVSAGLGRSVGGAAVQRAAVLPLLKYSRDQERAADALALRALARVYGHVGGAGDVFRVLAAATPGEAARIALLQTHPLGEERVLRVGALARENGWLLDGPRTPLPPELRAPAAKK